MGMSIEDVYRKIGECMGTDNITDPDSACKALDNICALICEVRELGNVGYALIPVVNKTVDAASVFIRNWAQSLVRSYLK